MSGERKKHDNRVKEPFIIIYSGADVRGTVKTMSTVLKASHINIDRVSMSSEEEESVLSIYILASLSKGAEKAAPNGKRLRKFLEVNLTRELQKLNDDYNRGNDWPTQDIQPVKVMPVRDGLSKTLIYIDFVAENRPGVVKAISEWLFDFKSGRNEERYSLEEIVLQPWLPKKDLHKIDQSGKEITSVTEQSDFNNKDDDNTRFIWFASSNVGAEENVGRMQLTISKKTRATHDPASARRELEEIVKEFEKLADKDGSFNIEVRSVKHVIYENARRHVVLGRR